MPANTPSRGYPYPVDTDLINVPGDIERLARAVDTVTAIETVRRFGSIAERNAAIPVPSEGQQCMVITAPGTGQGVRFIGRGGLWSPLGAMVIATKSGTQSITADAAYQVVSYTSLYWNVLSAYNGSVWTAPFRGIARIEAGIHFTVSNATFPQGAIGGHHCAFGVGWNTNVLGGDAFFGQFGQCALKIAQTINVNAGDTISAQAWCNAVGFSKTLFGSPGDNSGFYIEYI